MGRSPARRRCPRGAAAALLAGLALSACGREEILHGLEESQANQVLVALDEGGVRAAKQREEGVEGAWRVEVSRSESARAQQILAERELPRQRPPGFGEVFGKGSVVPTPIEERALYLHALSGELARSLEAIEGVLAARVHLALPPADSLRLEPAPPPRAAVLVKARPGARARIEPLAPGIQSLVAGAVAGLDPAAVSVVVAEGAAPAPHRQGDGSTGGRRNLLLALAGAAALLGIALPSLAVAASRLDLARFFRRAT
jgi:type III secretion protein J